MDRFITKKNNDGGVVAYKYVDHLNKWTGVNEYGEFLYEYNASNEQVITWLFNTNATPVYDMKFKKRKNN